MQHSRCVRLPPPPYLLRALIIVDVMVPVADTIVTLSGFDPLGIRGSRW